METLNPESIFNPANFSIDTPMIDCLKDQIHSWLWNGIGGGCITGDYRIGKTHAISRIVGCLTTRNGEKIETHAYSIATRDYKTIASVFRNLCISFNIKLSSRTTADDMSEHLVHKLGELSLFNSEKRVILIVDEFQRLSVSQLDAFAELYDKLAYVGVNLFIVFIGNGTASEPLVTSIMEQENELIRGRFFNVGYEYYGIRNHQELNECLRQFDRKIEWNGVETSISGHFAGELQGDKWKISSLSHLIWNVYKAEYQSDLKTKSWPMQYFLATIRTLLADYISSNDLQDKTDVEEMIRQSIKISGLVSKLVRSRNV